jgi:hypothetical protein
LAQPELWLLVGLFACELALWFFGFSATSYPRKSQYELCEWFSGHSYLWVVLFVLFADYELDSGDALGVSILCHAIFFEPFAQSIDVGLWCCGSGLYFAEAVAVLSYEIH